MNLLLLLLSLLIVLLMLFAVFARERNGRQPKRGSRATWWAMNLLCAIAAGLLFILTQDMRAPMIVVDVWTIPQAVICLLQLVTVAFGRSWTAVRPTTPGFPY